MNSKKAYENMSDSEMRELLYELSNSMMYQAILRYNGARDVQLMNSLAVLDPFKEPTAMARNQGHRNGLKDLEDAVDIIVSDREEADGNKKD